jgi:hypothetical protein
MKQANPLTFDWRAHDSSLVRLGLATLVTLSGIIAMFIVFRVVTPESRPVDVRPQQVVLLDPHVPAELALIHQAMDRSFGLLPSDSPPIGPKELLKMPTFEPSYAKRELRLRPLPSGLTTSTQTQPFALDMDILPPLPAPQEVKAQKRSKAVLKAVIEGPLATRAPEQVQISDVALADTTRPRFQVAIGSLGQVIVALPLSSSDDAEINQKLHHAITQMRFQPDDKETEWGKISFEWVKEGAAP